MMDDDDGWQLLPKPPKRSKKTCFERCIFCQTSNDVLRTAKPSSIEKVISALKIRQDEVSQRLSPNDLQGTEEKAILWHSSCYEAYTSKQNLRYCACEMQSSSGVAQSQARGHRISFDWSKCIFCKNATWKKDRKLINVATFEACNSIKESAEAREDHELSSVLQSVNHDLIAAEGKYHKACHASYISKVNIKYKQRQASAIKENIFDQAFNCLLKTITPEIESGKAYDMNGLLAMFQRELERMGSYSKSYTKQKLKARLMVHFQEQLVFHQPPQQSKPEIVYSSKISLIDVLNATSNSPLPETSSSMTKVQNETTSNLLDIYYIAVQIRQDILKCKGIDINPLNVGDLQLDTAKALLPQSLYWLIRWIVTGEQYSDSSSLSASNTTDERKIIMSSQDLVHCASHARVKLPKHVGLAMSVKHLTGSKQLITLLNRMGHCSSYEEIEQVETSLANENLARADVSGVLIPTNINPGTFIQMAADNNDINEETIDGKNTTHATTMAIYQRKQYGPMPARVVHADHSNKKRSLDSSRNLIVIKEINVGGRRPGLSSYVENDSITWFQSDQEFLSACTDDLCWMLLRLSDIFLTHKDEPPEAQRIPGWSGFNAITHPTIPVETNIGYHPMINAEASNFNTLYTLMKLGQKICNSLEQRDCVITFDLALYAKAKQIQMKYPDEFKNTVIRMGGFHIALNYLSLLGKKYAQSGLEDLLIESGVYAAGTTSLLMLGKSYNRGIRAHKLCMEALFRQLWKAFLEWLPKQAVELEERIKQLFVDKSRECRNTVKEESFVNQGWLALQGCLEPLTTLLTAFKSESREKSRNFIFWEEYIDMVLVLLQFIKAERTGNWKLHLSATAAMVCHFFSMDRVNYARWLPVYLSDMSMLELNHPEVFHEFLSGNHSVSRSKQPFAQVWPDMALEQSINLDSKSKGGIIGISKREDAVERWFLTSHERAAITQALKEMCGIDNYDRIGTHKEGRAKRMIRDETDVQKLVSTFNSGLLSDPFKISDDMPDEEVPLPLSNLATGVVLPDSTANSLLGATEAGRQSMKTFISSRIQRNDINFWDPIKKLKIKSFSSVAKKTVMKNQTNMLSVNADRELFGRLLVAAKNRDINLKEVLSYELCSVPISLAHPDGSLRKTTKSALMHLLEKDVTCHSSLPTSQLPTAFLIDAMALIQMVKSSGSETFGELSQKYEDIVITALRKNGCKRVDLIFDQYRSVSIKAGERSRRGESSSLEVNIHSGSTPVPKQWQKFTSNPKNKKNLAEFLCKSLSEHLPARLGPLERVVLAGGFSDGSKVVSLVQGSIAVEQSLRSDHEEADTRLLLHAKDAAATHPRIVIQSPDTDVTVLSVAHFEELCCQELWFKTGIKDRHRYIPVHTIQSSLGEPLCKSLLPFHALTGCDSTSAFSGIGKKKAWKILLRKEELQRDISNLGESSITEDPVLKVAESFICSVYSPGRNFSSADDARYFLFCQKSVKSEALPPTSDCLSHHIKRANFQAFIWKRALVPLQNIPSAEGNGWTLENDKLLPVLMTKSPAPSGITELTKCRCTTSECKRNCSCRMNNLACTEACLCMAEEGCSNPLNGELLAYDSSSDSETE